MSRTMRASIVGFAWAALALGLAGPLSAQARQSAGGHYLFGDGSVRFLAAGTLMHEPAALAPNQTLTDITDGTSTTLVLAEALPALQQALRDAAREGTSLTVQINGRDPRGRTLQHELKDVQVTSVRMNPSSAATEVTLRRALTDSPG